MKIIRVGGRASEICAPCCYPFKFQVFRYDLHFQMIFLYLGETKYWRRLDMKEL